MPPPQLSADAPVLDIPHPGEIGVFPLLGYELDIAIFHRGNGWLGQFPGVHIPLIGEVGLDDDARAVAPRDIQAVLIDFFEQPQGVHVGDYPLARLATIEAAVGLLAPRH